MSGKADLIKDWLKKADHDLGTAELTLAQKPEYTDTICFHCQQAVEKCFKACLVHFDIIVPKIHNLAYLLDLIVERNPEFKLLYEEAEKLEDFSVEVRYPVDGYYPPVSEATESLEIAKKIRIFTGSKLP